MRLRKRRSPEEEYPEYYDDDFKDPERSQGGPKQPRKRAGGRFWIHLLVLGIIIILFVGTVRILAGQVMFERTVQALLAPAGLVWIGLSLTLYFCLLRRQPVPAIIAFLTWLGLTAAGNQFVANSWIGSLETDYRKLDAREQNYDVVLVLGGAANTSPAGTAQGSAGADRVLVAAELYRQGRVQQIVCGGTSGLPLAENEMAVGEATAQVLMRLGVDAEAIVRVEGTHTLAEIQAFDRWLNEQVDRKDLRIGVLSSAWHLNRVMRLTETVGIDATAIPANFLGRPLRPAPDLLIPSEDNLQKTRLALKETIAGLFGR